MTRAGPRHFRTPPGERVQEHCHGGAGSATARTHLRFPRWPLALAGGLLAGCATSSTPEAWTPTSPCVSTTSRVSDEITWVRPDDPDQQARLETWCQAVGPAHVGVASSSGDIAPIDTLAILVWNTHVGAGEVRRLIADLRSGHLTDGVPVTDFVLLLQEVHRGGVDVPAAPPTWSDWAGRIDSAPEKEARIDVVGLARSEDLHLFYAPSMRNGAPGEPGAPEDRGNAILSTRRLSHLTAVELPWERQRRVAVTAQVAGVDRNGNDWILRVVSAHLDNRAAWSRIHRSFGAAQSNQARGLIAALDEGVPTALGADLNTWYRKRDIGAVALLDARFASLSAHPGGSSARIPFLPDLRLDYLFFDVPERWSTGYRVLPDSYGSDHKPLLGWVGVGTGSMSLKQADGDALNP